VIALVIQGVGGGLAASAENLVDANKVHSSPLIVIFRITHATPREETSCLEELFSSLVSRSVASSELCS